MTQVLAELEACAHDALTLAKRARANGQLQLADQFAEVAWRLASLHDRARQLAER